MKTALAFLTCLAATAAAFGILAKFAPVNDRPYFHGGKWQATPAAVR